MRRFTWLVVLSAAYTADFELQLIPLLLLSVNEIGISVQRIVCETVIVERCTKRVDSRLKTNLVHLLSVSLETF